MDSEIKFWEYVILSGRKIEPKDKKQESCFEIAEYYLSQKKEKEKKVA